MFNFLKKKPAEPLVQKYSGQSGTSSSDNDSTQINWKWPVCTTNDLKNCEKGNHKLSQQLLVDGWVSYFTRIGRYYCACGKMCWIWYIDGFADTYTGNVGDHEKWVDGHIEMQETFKKHKEREDERFRRVIPG